MYGSWSVLKTTEGHANLLFIVKIDIVQSIMSTMISIALYDTEIIKILMQSIKHKLKVLKSSKKKNMVQEHGTEDKGKALIVPRLFEEKRRDMVFGFPSFRPSVHPSVLPSPYRSMYLVCATPPTVLFQFFLNFTDVITML